MKIVFMGTAELSCASLQALADDKQFSVAAVVTQPDRPKGRELKPQPSPVKIARAETGLAGAPAGARPRRDIPRRTARVGARSDRRGRLRTDFAAKHFGFAAAWLSERPHVAAAEISRRGADSVGDCQRRRRNRRDHHENGRRSGHRAHRGATPHADSAGGRFGHAA